MVWFGLGHGDDIRAVDDVGTTHGSSISRDTRGRVDEVRQGFLEGERADVTFEGKGLSDVRVRDVPVSKLRKDESLFSFRPGTTREGGTYTGGGWTYNSHGGHDALGAAGGLAAGIFGAVFIVGAAVAGASKAIGRHTWHPSQHPTSPGALSAAQSWAGLAVLAAALALVFVLLHLVRPRRWGWLVPTALLATAWLSRYVVAAHTLDRGSAGRSVQSWQQPGALALAGSSVGIAILLWRRRPDTDLPLPLFSLPVATCVVLLARGLLGHEVNLTAMTNLSASSSQDLQTGWLILCAVLLVTALLVACFGAIFDSSMWSRSHPTGSGLLGVLCGGALLTWASFRLHHYLLFFHAHEGTGAGYHQPDAAAWVDGGLILTMLVSALPLVIGLQALTQWKRGPGWLTLGILVSTAGIEYATIANKIMS
jgi:hypothetical protein